MLQPVSTVTFGVIAYNEQMYLPDLLKDLLRQTYDKKLIEVILVDGESQDSTFEIMKSFQAEFQDAFLDVKTLSNYKRIQPSGWNVVIKNSTADALLRIDAHARLPKNFVENSIKCLNTDEFVCGGPRENIIDERTSWKEMLLVAEQSMFGAGIASYRQGVKEKKYVKSVFHGCYRKEVLDKVGLFDETLVRTEDNEYHYRIYKAGYRICYDSSIHSFYQTRNSLKGMLRQKFGNGFWVGRTLFKCPGCISLFHLVPFLFVCAILFSSILLLGGVSLPAKLLWGTYGLVNILMTVISIIRSKGISVYSILLPLVFLLLHIGYGLGTLFGLVKRESHI